MKAYSCSCGEMDNANFYSGSKSCCKKCYRARVRTNRKEKADYYSEYERSRAKLPHRVELRKTVAERWKSNPLLKTRLGQQKKKWALDNSAKRAAHIILGNAVRDGKVQKMPCVICGAQKSEGHHDDYTKPLDVIWLCRLHHGQLHTKKKD